MRPIDRNIAGNAICETIFSLNAAGSYYALFDVTERLMVSSEPKCRTVIFSSVVMTWIEIQP